MKLFKNKWKEWLPSESMSTVLRALDFINSKLFEKKKKETKSLHTWGKWILHKPSVQMFVFSLLHFGVFLLQCDPRWAFLYNQQTTKSFAKCMLAFYFLMYGNTEQNWLESAWNGFESKGKKQTLEVVCFILNLWQR